jgi:tetratricopeptide (TPR) repeat protein
MKFNPGVKGDNELINSFVARTNDLRTVLDLLFSKGKNVLVVGPRGAGKTTLARRVAAEVRMDPDLSQKWTPLVFAEEAYEISSVGEFWLEALYRLRCEEPNKKWALLYDNLKRESSHDELARRGLAALKEYAHETDKNVLIVAENLTLLLDEQLAPTASTQLVKALKKEQWLRFLGTALPSFEESEIFEQSWSEHFEVMALDPLTLKDCSALWRSVARRSLSNMQLRPVQILTGGNPRLIRILADFAGRASFRELMDDLIHLVDEHTEYFKSRLDNLPPMERKVFVAILQHWDPISARDIADDSRIEVTGVSPLLLRLQKRGIVSVVPGQTRKLYQASERLYNIYYLLRRGGESPENRVRLAVRFMVQFYRGRRLIDRARKLAIEACQLAPSQRNEHYLAYRELFECSISSRLKDQIRDAIPQEFLAGIPNNSAEIEGSKGIVARAHVLFSEGQIKQSEELFRKAIEINPTNGHARAHLAVLLEKRGDTEEAFREFRLATSLSPDDDWAALRFAQFLLARGDKEEKEESDVIVDRIYSKPDLSAGSLEHLASVLHDMQRYEQSEQTCLRFIAIAPSEDLADAWYSLAELYHYHLGKYVKAQEAYKKSLAAKSSPWVLTHYADLLERMNKRKESIKTLESAVSLLRDMPKSVNVWGQLGRILLDHLDKAGEAVDAFKKASELSPEIPEVWTDLGRALANTGAFEESEAALRKSINLKGSVDAFSYLGLVLTKLKKYKDAEQIYSTAIDLEPLNPAPLAGYGSLLEEHMGQIHAAIECYSKALSLGGEAVIPSLVRAKMQTGESEAVLVSEIQNHLATSHDSQILNNVAWTMYRSGTGPLLILAEETARRALRIKPNDWPSVHTLAMILGKLNRWNETLELATELIDAVGRGNFPLQDFADLIIEAAAAGYASQCLRLLGASPVAASLEPLVVGLELHLGNKPVVAQEILEVAKDVAGRIESKTAPVQ